MGSCCTVSKCEGSRVSVPILCTMRIDSMKRTFWFKDCIFKHISPGRHTVLHSFNGLAKQRCTKSCLKRRLDIADSHLSPHFEIVDLLVNILF
ncbi:hypothetical protein OESDEN_02760 [Oesophagostomum dentatum]|uniref:Uncharacterized protein n=1 Tax=Oesophagostomum dentatum TaxID=61180 RepID=A0A0B1TN53_OESDE|nr:hypothetical protein OESDEN_02760 [Oesophagostomum dentatum]